MRFATVLSRAQLGLTAPEVAVEVHLTGGLSSLNVIGLVETAVRESRDRVRAAIQQSGLQFPEGRKTIHLAPADLPKSGSRFDLAIAVGVLAASRQVSTGERLCRHEFLGELAFSGALRPVPGMLTALMAARRSGRQTILPAACEAEAALLGGDDIHLAEDLLAVVRYLQEGVPLRRPGAAPPAVQPPAEDLAEVRGQTQARRALEIAAAGGHHLLFFGPPGTGKTMLARRLPGLLPPLASVEALDVAALRSLAGLTGGWGVRPFRAPHHTASAAALVGGGSDPRPGEISLAHNGVLFLDELPEFSRTVLEALREPLSTGVITIARARRCVEFPAGFQLVAAMNPCPCGFAGDPQQVCRCSPQQVRRYQLRISGPLLDRIDMAVPVRRVSMAGPAVPGEASAVVRARVLAAIDRRCARQPVPNARLEGAGLLECRLGTAARSLLETAAERFALSSRAVQSVTRVARTVADLNAHGNVEPADMAEAIALRTERLETAVSGIPA